MSHLKSFLYSIVLIVALFAAPARAEEKPLLQLPPPPAAASGATGKLDAEAATRAYLDELPAEQRAKSNAYFEGGYWLQLVDFVWLAVVYLFLLQSGLSARMRDRAEKLTRHASLQIAAYWTQLMVATTLLTLPLGIYRDYYREHAYGLSNLTFGDWLGEEAKGFGLTLFFGSLAMMILYRVVRKLPRTWWIWGSAAAVCFIAFGSLIAPVLIVPLFNKPVRLADQRVVAPILSLARASGIRAGEVWEIDASKQSKRVSANVSGIFGTERITLNDNLLNRASLPEIEAVMGHEMGHYVLNHVYKGLMEFGLIIVAGFAVLQGLFEKLRARFPRWQINGVGDTAGLPLAMLVLAAFFLLITPITNTITRTAEIEADIFGLNAARQPDGFARISLQLSEYRKLEPGPIEEFVFFDHPSGHTRIFSAMRWKAEHPEVWKSNGL